MGTTGPTGPPVHNHHVTTVPVFDWVNGGCAQPLSGAGYSTGQFQRAGALPLPSQLRGPRASPCQEQKRQPIRGRFSSSRFTLGVGPANALGGTKWWHLLHQARLTWFWENKAFFS